MMLVFFPHGYDPKSLFCQKGKCKPGRNHQAGGQGCLFSENNCNYLLSLCCVVLGEKLCINARGVFSVLGAHKLKA